MFRRQINLLLAGAVVLTCASLAVAQPACVDLGSITGDTFTNGVLATSTVDWYCFSTPGAVSPTSWLDIHTNNTTLMTSTGTSTDTEIGLYDSLGNLVATDDDDGISLRSVLSFGTGSGQMLGDPLNLGGNGLAEGEDGDLPAGSYYLAFGGFNTTFNATNWDATSTSTRFGDYQIDFLAGQVPEPAALSLIGLGLAALCVARRRG